MDPRERYEDAEEAIRAALQGWQAKMWTALPAIIESVNLTKLTVSAQPTIQGHFTSATGVMSNLTLPLCLDVPIFYPQGGGYTLTFPVAQGDECLLVFSSRCIDGWWSRGGVQAQLDFRMHDLSDGFALVGFRSQARLLTSVPANAAQLRSDDGDNTLTLGPSGALTINVTGNVTVHAGGSVSVSGATVALNP